LKRRGCRKNPRTATGPRESEKIKIKQPTATPCMRKGQEVKGGRGGAQKDLDEEAGAYRLA